MAIKALKSNKFIASIWLFPALLTVAFLVLVSLGVSGSSVGLYHKIFYGDQKDTALLANQPQSIRSDEWLLGSAKTLGQYNNHFKEVNPNIGNGENQGFLSDAPALGMTTPFKPHNFGFFVLPFDNAFAFKWWALSYMLLLSVYFFVLAVLPRKRLLAILIAFGLLFSPFVQWWYLYGTLGSLAFTLFGLTAFIKLLDSKTRLQAFIWSLFIGYLAVCFVLVLYPPFQIACALVGITYLVAHFLQRRSNIPNFKEKLFALGSSLVIAVIIIGVIFVHYTVVVKALADSAYPGKREVYSGFYSLTHLFSGNTSMLLQDPERSIHYQRPEINAVNNSESSNFIYISVFLLPPLFLMAYQKFRKRKELNWEIIGLIILSLGLFAWLFVPHITLLGKLFLLDKVPHPRLLIGLGLLNTLVLVAFIKYYSKLKQSLSLSTSLIYSLIILVLYLALDSRISLQMPGFITYKESLYLALIIPVIVFLLLRRYFILALSLFVAVSFFSVWKINPLYHGTKVLSENPLVLAIKDVSHNDNKRWVSDDINIENFAAMSGASSLSGTYIYPQVDLWKSYSPQTDSTIYNRYAHVNFNFDRDEQKIMSTRIFLVGTDQFAITTEPCSPEFKKVNVGHLITTLPFTKAAAPCAQLIKTLPFTTKTYYIYNLNL